MKKNDVADGHQSATRIADKPQSQDISENEIVDDKSKTGLSREEVCGNI